MSEHQHFWRCAHHPSAIDNFFETRITCEWQCHETQLKSFDSGFHQRPKSWSARRGFGTIADQIFGV